MLISDITTFGGQSISPLLSVTAPSGSTIDIIQNSIVLQTYTLGDSETEHTFKVKKGSYTVRGTNGSKTKSVSVSVTGVGIYSATIEYKTYLYNEGDECESFTGGIGASVVAYNGVSATVTKNANSISVTESVNADGYVTISTNKTGIDLSQYSKVGIQCDELSTHVRYLRFDSTTSYGGSSTALSGLITSGTEPTFEGTLSNNYLNLTFGTSTSLHSINIYKIWLEE